MDPDADTADTGTADADAEQVDTLEVDRDERGVVTLRLRRPGRRNALDAPLTRALTATLDRLADDGEVRVVVLTGTGTAFCAGADLDWMRAGSGDAEGDVVSWALAELFGTLDGLPCPVVVRVNGHARGGGMGLVACADVVVAAGEATFGFTEVRLGLAPAVIAPHVLAAIGRSAARRWLLTGEVFDARRARALGLVHEVSPAGDLDAATDHTVTALLAGGRRAQAEIKALLARLGSADPGGHAAVTVPVLARLRASREARDRIAAFLDVEHPDGS